MQSVRYLLLFLLLLAGISSTAQEICDNGKDDDGDGLIDIQDPDCQCHFNVTGNLLQNASFESHENCPTNYTYDADYKIVNNWQYGTYTNTNEANYYHNLTCRYDSAQVNLFMPPALPLPDGKAFVSVKQDVYRKPGIQETDVAKTYIGQCLPTPLQPAQPYTLSFSAGRFQSHDDPTFKFKSSPITVALFGHPDCNAVPFGKARANSNGCPANYAGWVLLGKVTVYSKGAWVQGRINFTVPYNINVIEIGPDCSIPVQNIDLTDSTTYLDFYQYYLDDLRLMRTKDFHFTYIQGQSGNSCIIDSILNAPLTPGASYQWYKNSIAIAGAIRPSYHIPGSSTPGNYNVRVVTANGCFISEPYATISTGLSKLIIPADTSFCEKDTLLLAPVLNGVTYTWNGRRDSVVKISQTGVYNITAADVGGCIKTFTVHAQAQDCINCTAYVPNAFTPNGDGRNDLFQPKISCSVTAYSLEIYDRWGQKIFKTNNSGKGWDGTYSGKKMPVGTYAYFIRYKTLGNTIKIAKGIVVLLQ